MARYVESAVLRVEDEASAQLAKIRRNFAQFSAAARKVQGQLERAGGMSNPPGGGGGGAVGGRSVVADLRDQASVAASVREAIQALSDAYAAAGGSASAFADAMAKTNAQLRQQARLTRAMQRLQERGIEPAGGSAAVANQGAGGGKAGAARGGDEAAVKHAAPTTVKEAETTVSKFIVQNIVDGMFDGSQARELLLQSGNINQEAVLRSIPELTNKFGVSVPDIYSDFAKVTRFADDGSAQALMVRLLERQKVLARQRGESESTVEQNAMPTFEGIRQMGLFNPGQDGKINAARISDVYEAQMRMRAIQGENYQAGGIEELGRSAGTRAQSLNQEGIIRAVMYGKDASGATAGQQMKFFDRVLSGAAGNGINKKSVDSLIKGGYIERDKSGAMHATDQAMYKADPTRFIAQRSIEQMRNHGLSETNPQQVDQFVKSLNLASKSLEAYITQAIKTNPDSQRAIDSSSHLRMSEDDAIGAKARSTAEALDGLGNAVKNAGAAIDDSMIGQGFRNVINGVTTELNNVTNWFNGKSDDPQAGAKAARAVIKLLGIAGLGRGVFPGAIGFPGATGTAADGVVPRAASAAGAVARGGVYTYLTHEAISLIDPNDRLGQSIDNLSSVFGNIDDLAWRLSGGNIGRSKEAQQWFREHPGETPPDAADFNKDPWKYLNAGKSLPFDAGEFGKAVAAQAKVDSIQKHIDQIKRPYKSGKMPSATKKFLASREEALEKAKGEVPNITMPGKDYLNKKKAQGWQATGPFGSGQQKWTGSPFGSNNNTGPVPYLPQESLTENFNKGIGMITDAALQVASSLSESGTAAASNMQQQAGAIGVTIGQAAAKEIKAATTNITVNVNANQKPLAPKGDTSPGKS